MLPNSNAVIAVVLHGFMNDNVRKTKRMGNIHRNREDVETFIDTWTSIMFLSVNFVCQEPHSAGFFI